MPVFVAYSSSTGDNNPPEVTPPTDPTFNTVAVTFGPSSQEAGQKVEMSFKISHSGRTDWFLDDSYLDRVYVKRVAEGYDDRYLLCADDGPTWSVSDRGLDFEGEEVYATYYIPRNLYWDSTPTANISIGYHVRHCMWNAPT